jgi:hypothetical protein
MVNNMVEDREFRAAQEIYKRYKSKQLIGMAVCFLFCIISLLTVPPVKTACITIALGGALYAAAWQVLGWWRLR